MNQSDIDYVIQEFGPVTWKSFGTKDTNEGVFLLKVTPLPPPNELEQVIADICTGGVPVYVKSGKVYHFNECGAQSHNILNPMVKEAIHKLKEETFNVAIHPNITLAQGELLYGGKPLAIAFDPAITYMQFPDHRHLNTGTYQRFLPNTQYSFSDTLCYTAAPNNALGITQRDRLLYTFEEVTIWLLRHQVWVAIRELTGKGEWIGPHEGELDPECFPLRLNPQGLCRCGSQKLYNSCHLKLDFASIRAKYGDIEAITQEKLIRGGWWFNKVLLPQRTLFQALFNLAK